MFDHLLIGLSGIKAANQSILVTGQNITKADIPLYHRLMPVLATTKYGPGVVYSDTIREQDTVIEKQFYNINEYKSYYNTILQYTSNIESIIISGDIENKLNNIYNSISQASINRVKLYELISNIDILSHSINNIYNQLYDIRNSISYQIEQYIGQINNYINNISQYNHNRTVNHEYSINDDIDKLLMNLTEIIDIRFIENQHGINILTEDGIPLVLADKSYQIQKNFIGTNIILSNSIDTIKINYGKLGALLYLYNEYIPKIFNVLDSNISELIRTFNHINATGIGSLGEYTSTSSSIPVLDIYSPLSTQNLPYDIFPGNLIISVTDTNTNNRNNYSISVDPNTQSLYDISNLLSSIPGIIATANSNAGLLTISSLPGYRFDFAGRDTIPPSSGSVSNPDSAGILSALGINGIFDGYNASTIRLRQQFIDNPYLIATSKTGEIANTDNLSRFFNTRQKSLFTQDNIISNMQKLISDIASFIVTTRDTYDHSQVTYNEIFTKLQETIGVDTNEEFIKLINYQKMLESSSKYISIINETYDTLLRILD
jgi:flagellar hook-associated protein FlgK